MLKSQQQPVVEHPRILNTVGINHQSASQHAKINEMVPKPVIAGQAGTFPSEDRAVLPVAHRREQPAEI